MICLAAFVLLTWFNIIVAVKTAAGFAYGSDSAAVGYLSAPILFVILESWLMWMIGASA